MVERIHAIMWDLGGVVLAFDQDKADAKLSADGGRSITEVSKVLFGDTAGDRQYSAGLSGLFNTGQFDEKEFYTRVKKALGLKMNYETFVDAWTDIFTRNELIIDYMERAHAANIPQCVLSSTDPLAMAKMRQEADLDRIIGRSRFVTTYEVRVKKPKKRLFEVASKKLQVPMERCVYVDDIRKYVDAALEHGVGAAIHVDITQSDFQERCIRDLQSLGFEL